MSIIPKPKLINRNVGFTLIELLLTLALMSLAVAIAAGAFVSIATIWRRGPALSDKIQHGDFIAEQLEMALRSAYYPQASTGLGRYGFTLRNNGDGENAEDEIEWVKMGTALIGRHSDLRGIPHRVRFTVGEDEDGERGATIRAWRLLGQSEDFDADVDTEPVFVSRGLQGFDCRVAYEWELDEIDWLDEWEYTNQLPFVLELTFYLPPVEEGADAIEIKRMVRLPAADICWKDKTW